MVSSRGVPKQKLKQRTPSILICDSKGTPLVSSQVHRFVKQNQNEKTQTDM